MKPVNEVICTRCSNVFMLKEGAVSREYCLDCKLAMRSNWKIKLASDRKLKTLRKNERETLVP